MVALYSRVSTQEQAVNGYSIGEQIDRMQKYAAAMKWTVYKVYTDAGYSGASLDRPALQALISDAKTGKIDKVLVYKLDRLSRSQKHTLYLIEDVFLASSVDFVSMSENFDTSTPFGRAMIGILAVFAQLEREQIKERMQLGHEARAKLGLYNGGRQTPTGYKYENGMLIPEPYEAMQVREAFNLAAAGLAPAKIAEALNARGYTHKCGKWSEATVRNVLHSRLYIGEIRYSGEWFPAPHEPIIPRELFDNVANILRNRSESLKRFNRRSGVSTTYLGGMLVCAHCGAKYAKFKYISALRSGKRYTYEYYVCNSQSRRRDYLIKDPNCKNKRWKMKELDDLIFGEIRKLSLDPDGLAAPEPKRDGTDRLSVLAAEVKKISGKISRLLDLYADGRTPLDSLHEKIDGLTAQKTALENQIAEIENAEAPKLSRSDAAGVISSFAEILDRGNFDEIRFVIETLIQRIELDGENVTIFWNFA